MKASRPYYAQLRSRKLEAQTAGDVEQRWDEDQFRILDPAQLPEKVSYPDPSLFLLVGTGAGLGAGLGLGFLLEVLDSSVKSQRQLEVLLPYPVVLTLPLMKPSGAVKRKNDADPASVAGLHVATDRHTLGESMV